MSIPKESKDEVLRRQRKAAMESTGAVGHDARRNHDRGDSGDDEPDSFVPDPVVRKEFGICELTLTRWDADKKLDFPPAIKINRRNYRSRRLLNKFKERLMKEAIQRRAEREVA